MQFTNPLFMLMLLLISFMIKFVPYRFRTMVIVVLSIGYLLYIQPVFTLLLVILTFSVYIMSLKEKTRLFSTIGVIVFVLFLLVLKYFKVINSIFPIIDNEISSNYLVPIGLSYLVFKFLSYILDNVKGIQNNRNIIEFFCFIFFIPSFPAGPIERYQDFAFSMEENISTQTVYFSLKRIIFGYCKKIILVEFTLRKIMTIVITPYINQNINGDIPFYFVLAIAIIYLLYAYLDLSSYADLAIGFGRLFGYKLSENMALPIFKSNISDYWSSWHITLSRWCRDYIYMPVMARTRNVYLGLFTSFLVMGLWHYIDVRWVMWGLWHAIGLSVYTYWSQNRKIQKFIRKKKITLGKFGSIVGTLGTVIYVSFSFIFVMQNDILVSLKLLSQLFH